MNTPGEPHELAWSVATSLCAPACINSFSNALNLEAHDGCEDSRHLSGANPLHHARTRCTHLVRSIYHRGEGSDSCCAPCSAEAVGDLSTWRSVRLNGNEESGVRSTYAHPRILQLDFSRRGKNVI